MGNHPNWQQEGGKSCVPSLSFPKPICNRPGLSHIDYRIGTFADFREWLMRRLNENDVLRAWTHRESDDPGIALLEGAAVLGDILTFYQELYANEAYLRTSQWRESVSDLVRLLGYRLSPGVGGIATFAFAVEENEPVVIPAGFPVKAQVEGLGQEAEFETLAEATAYSALSQFKLYRPLVKATISNGTSRFSMGTAAMKTAEIELKEGDRLMLLKDPSNASTNHQVVVIEKIEVFFDRTEIHIEGSWQGGSVGASIKAYKLGRTFRHYGYNGPVEEVTVQETKAVDFTRKLYEEMVYVVEQIPGILGATGTGGYYYSKGTGPYGWAPNPGGSSSPGGNPGSAASSKIRGTPALTARSMPLNAEVDDLAVDAKILVKLRLQATSSSKSGTEKFFERKISKITQGTCRVGVLSGGTTIIKLNQAVYDGNLHYADIRSMELLEVIGKRFSLEGVYKKTISADLSTLYIYEKSKAYEKLDGRSLLCVKKDGTYEKVVASIDKQKTSSDDQEEFRPLTLSGFTNKFSLVDFPLRAKATVTVYGNLVNADQGKTEKEAVLGNGDSRQKFQTFKLPKSPLTYHKSAGTTPPEVPELKIYVDNRLWKQVPVFFERKGDEEVYVVREDAQGDSWVQFGDGKTGRRLPSGLKNVVAKYRTGTGAYGALKKDTTVQAGGQLKRLDEVFMPTPSSGGDDPESSDNARQAAPGKVQSLDRLVSLQDFESEALAIAGVTKTLARWALVDGVPTVVLTVLMKSGREKEIEQVRKIIDKYNRCRGADRFPIQVLAGQFMYVYVAAAVAYNSTYRQKLVETAIKEALGLTGEEGDGVDGSQGLFALNNRRFGENEYATRIAGIIQNVDGVLWTKVNSLFVLCQPKTTSTSTPSVVVCGTIKPSDLTIPSDRPLNEILACDDRHILSLYKGHLGLVAMSGSSGEGC
jgi:hypothetical protein